jgi:hypothetical protein
VAWWHVRGLAALDNAENHDVIDIIPLNKPLRGKRRFISTRDAHNVPKVKAVLRSGSFARVLRDSHLVFLNGTGDNGNAKLPHASKTSCLMIPAIGLCPTWPSKPMGRLSEVEFQ